MDSYIRKVSQPVQQRIRMKLKQDYTKQTAFMYAKTKWQNQLYSSGIPGTNCEYDSADAFERAGANTIVKVFKNMNANDNP